MHNIILMFAFIRPEQRELSAAFESVVEATQEVLSNPYNKAKLFEDAVYLRCLIDNAFLPN